MDEQKLVEDFVATKARFEATAGRTLTDEEFTPHYTRLMGVLAGEAFLRISAGMAWEQLTPRALCAVEFWSHCTAAEIASHAGIDLEAGEDDARALVFDDEAMRGAIGRAMHELNAWDRERDPHARLVNSDTIVEVLVACFCRARLETQRRGDASPPPAPANIN